MRRVVFVDARERSGDEFGSARPIAAFSRSPLANLPVPRKKRLVNFLPPITSSFIFFTLSNSIYDFNTETQRLRGTEAF